MSDPNGLVFYKGKYHLFYQYNPQGIQPANQSWGHAISTDLVNWEEKPVAIPVQNGIMAFSGSVVVDWNNTSGFGINGQPPLVAIYTGASNSNVQDQRIAYSNDEGLTWTSYNQNPVLTSIGSQFRDPKVIWHEESQKWIMVITFPNDKKIHFYSSPNLKTWTFLQAFGNLANISAAWECPDFFKMPVNNNTKWILAHSVAPNAQYFIGDFTGQQFTWANTAPTGLLIDDFERDNYGGWTATGQAFGDGPSPATTVTAGSLGNRFVYSFITDNSSQGKLVSAEFLIQKKYISFLLGGGYHPNGTYIKLVVNGQAVRSSTGMNEDLMKWRNWDVSPLIGQMGRIEIVDSITEGWGHINVDHIVQSDVINEITNNGQIDYGKDFYALQSFSDVANGRKIWLAWMNDWSYAEKIPTTPWKGIMSIPREVTLETRNGQIKLIQKPVPELTILRKDTLSFQNTSIVAINNAVTNLKYKHFELKAKIAALNNKGFSLKVKKGGSQYTEFIFDFINNQIIFDRSKSSALTDADWNFRQLQVAPLIIENGFVDLHLFVDNCSAELFASNGQIVMSNQIFPDSTSNRIELNSLSGDLVFNELNIWNFGKRDTLPPPPPPPPPPVVIDQGPMFRVYPNPVIQGNDVTVKINNQMTGKVKFKLFNASGMLISEFQPSANSITIPGNKLAASSGIYFLKGSDGNTILTKTLLVVEK